MLVAIGDTHDTDDHCLEGAALEAVRAAETVIHTGDFTRIDVLEAFEKEAADLRAVSGNNDDRQIRERVPEVRTVDALGIRFVVAHGHGRNDTSLSLLARQEEADVVIVGHSHMPGIRGAGDVPIVNPGSHADPRWHTPAFAVFEKTGEGEVAVRLETPDGETLETATLPEGRSG